MILLVHIGIYFIFDAYQLVTLIPRYIKFPLFQGKKNKN